MGLGGLEAQKFANPRKSASQSEAVNHASRGDARDVFKSLLEEVTGSSKRRSMPREQCLRATRCGSDDPADVAPLLRNPAFRSGHNPASP
jgi:hypothetical protein